MPNNRSPHASQSGPRWSRRAPTLSESCPTISGSWTFLGAVASSVERTPRLVVLAALHQRIIPKRLDFTKHCRNVARDAPRKVTPGDPYNLRSCPRVVQELSEELLQKPSVGRNSVKSGFGHILPESVRIRQIPTKFDRKWSTWTISGPNLAHISPRRCRPKSCRFRPTSSGFSPKPVRWIGRRKFLPELERNCQFRANNKFVACFGNEFAPIRPTRPILGPTSTDVSPSLAN